MIRSRAVVVRSASVGVYLQLVGLATRVAPHTVVAAICARPSEPTGFARSRGTPAAVRRRLLVGDLLGEPGSASAGAGTCVTPASAARASRRTW